MLPSTLLCQGFPMLRIGPTAPYILKKTFSHSQPPPTFILHFIVIQGPPRLPSLISLELSCGQAALSLELESLQLQLGLQSCVAKPGQLSQKKI